MEGIAQYDRALPGASDHSYDWLFQCLVRRTELNWQQPFREYTLAHHRRDMAKTQVPPAL